MANVIIFPEKDSSKAALFMSTDSSGVFSGSLITPGRYDLRIQLIGFTPFRKSIQVSTGSIDLGTINMLLENYTMQEVTVTGRKKLIQRTNTGFTVQTDAIITQAAGTATDLLANIPSIRTEL
jgi:hypothetical protein